MHRAARLDDNGDLHRAGVARPTLSELVDEKRGISLEMSVRLSKVFGGKAEGWLIQQAQYDLAQIRRDRPNLKRLKTARPLPSPNPNFFDVSREISR
jgi:plasmid maintenance system antidote protein VapI